MTSIYLALFFAVLTMASALDTSVLVSFLPHGNTEGLDYDEDTGIFYVSTYYEGLWAVQKDETGQFYVENVAVFEGTTYAQITGVKIEDDFVAINCHDIDEHGVTTEMNGRWRIPKHIRDATCSLDVDSPCEKLYPLNDEPISFIDGLVFFQRYEFVSDPDWGNIWRYDRASEEFVVWTGTNSTDPVNYLQGDPTAFLYSTNNKGLGFGCNQLTVDKKGKTIYTIITDTCQVVGIPINDDGSAGEQFLVGNDHRGVHHCDGIYYDHVKDRLLATSNIRFNATAEYLISQGATLFEIDLTDDNPQSVVYVDDPVLGFPADVIVAEIDDERVIVSTDLDLFLTGSTGLKMTIEN